MQQNIRTIFPFKASRTTRLICLAIAFFIGLCFTSLITTTVPADNRAALLFQSAVQSVVAFILPAWVAFKAFYISPEKDLGISDGYPVRSLLVTLLTMACAIPFLNEVIAFNESISFPASLQSAFREWEATAGAYTERMLDTTTVGGMLSGVLVIGVLTGTAEEIFFRPEVPVARYFSDRCYLLFLDNKEWVAEKVARQWVLENPAYISRQRIWYGCVRDEFMEIKKAAERRKQGKETDKVGGNE